MIKKLLFLTFFIVNIAAESCDTNLIFIKIKEKLSAAHIKEDEQKKVIVKEADKKISHAQSQKILIRPKHTVTYDELLENFEYYNKAKDLSKFIIDKNALLQEAELWIENYEKLSHHEEIKNNIAGCALATGCYSLLLFTSIFDITGKLLSDNPWIRLAGGIIGTGGMILFSSAALANIYELNNRDSFLVDKMRHEKIRDWLKSLK
jgi:hypothetical protein